ncbi:MULTISPECIES: M48 family metallopeptidase [unclassified Marinovum]
MGQHSLPGNPPVPLRLRTSAQARRITLRISSLDGTVTLTKPRGVTEREALAFAREKEDWLRSHLEKQSGGIDVATGVHLPIEGTPRAVLLGPGRQVQLLNDRVLVPGPADRIPARLLGFLKAHARTRLAQASDRYATQLGLPYTKLTLRDTRSRWGSCTSQGGLMYSWRLILAPPEVLDYVAAHEVAHLREMNHSAAFWSVVRDLYGPHEAQRRWLHTEGAALHRIRFGG